MNWTESTNDWNWINVYSCFTAEFEFGEVRITDSVTSLFKTVNLLWNNLYHAKHYIIKVDLTWSLKNTESYDQSVSWRNTNLIKTKQVDKKIELTKMLTVQYVQKTIWVLNICGWAKWVCLVLKLLRVLHYLNEFS